MPLPPVNPITGLTWSKNDTRQFTLASLQPISPWLSISLLEGSLTNCRCPDYLEFVEHKSVIYIYRLRQNTSISYIGSAESGSIKFATHRKHCSAFIRDIPSKPQDCKGFI
jgi:hypothetical protein